MTADAAIIQTTKGMLKAAYTKISPRWVSISFSVPNMMAIGPCKWSLIIAMPALSAAILARRFFTTWHSTWLSRHCCRKRVIFSTVRPE